MSDDILDQRARSLEEGSPAHLAALLGHPATWTAAPDLSVAAMMAAADATPDTEADPGVRPLAAVPSPVAVSAPVEVPSPVAAPVAGAGPVEASENVVPISAARSRRQRLYRPLLAAAAVLVFVAAITTGVLATQERPTATIALSGTTGAPEAHGRIRVIERDAGWRLVLDVQGLAPAAPGTYYQGWAIRDGVRVPLGTFHMHQAGKVELWSGVPLRQFRRIEVTKQDVGAGQDPGTLVLAGGM